MDYDSDVFARVLAVHVLGTFHVLKHGGPHMRDGGSVVITSSAVGLVGTARLSAYVAPSTRRLASCAPPPRSSHGAASPSTRSIRDRLIKARR